MEEFKENPSEIEYPKDKKTLTEKIRENPWIASTIVLLGLFVLVLIFNNTEITSNVIGEEKAEKTILNYLDNLGAETDSIEITDVSLKSGVYEISFDYQGEPYPAMFYLTQDGKFAGNLNSLDFLKNNSDTNADISNQNILKSDKPIVELFVMTHCPYGAQAEKGIISAIETLGNNIDGKIRFVHYFMHTPEEEETPRQVCIREEQSEKWYDYLKCFLEDGNSSRCVSESKTDKSKLDLCIQKNAEAYYKEDSKLSNNYGVRGSPTFVINGKQIDSDRNSQSYLNTICFAFDNTPEECNTKLSTKTPPAGFGWQGTETSTANAQCG